MTPAPAEKHTIWLVRHGLSTGNRDGIRQGQRSFELAPEGQRQAQALAGRLESVPNRFDALIASPLTRARQTAEIVSAALDLEIEFDERWQERGAGVAEGQVKEELASENQYATTPHAHEPIFKHAESKLDLHLRAVQALQTLLRRPAGRYLVISHGGIMSAALRAALGLAPRGRATEAGFAFANTGVAVLTYDHARGHWILERLNDGSHLST